jgi:hypothetical protein
MKYLHSLYKSKEGLFEKWHTKFANSIVNTMFYALKKGNKKHANQI